MQTEEPSSRTHFQIKKPTSSLGLQVHSKGVLASPNSRSSQTSMEATGLIINGNLSYEQLYNSLDLDPPEISFVVLCLAGLLNRMVKENQNKSPPKSIFHSKKIPGVSIENYLERLAKYSKCSPETLFLALIYLDRYFEKNTDQCLVALNVHKLFFISFVTAAKFNDDLKVSNQIFAKVGGIDKFTLCVLEMQFLRNICFHLNVSSIEYISYVRSAIDFIDKKTHFN